MQYAVLFASDVQEYMSPGHGFLFRNLDLTSLALLFYLHLSETFYSLIEYES